MSRFKFLMSAVGLMFIRDYQPMKKSLPFAMSAVLALTFAFVSCGGGDKTVAVTSVSLNKTAITLNINEQETLTATVQPSNATNTSVTWSSSNNNVAIVNGNGSTATVTAVAGGNAAITVRTADGGKEYTCTVTVRTPPESVSLSQNSMRLDVGTTGTLTATILPNNATNKNVTWSSSNNNVATVSGNGLNATVTAVAAGNAVITVRTEDGGKEYICTVTVTPIPVPVESVSIEQNSMMLVIGDAGSLTATIVPGDATTKNVMWSSSNSNVATVTGYGLNATVTAVTAGNAVITVRTEDGGKESTCSVTVATVPVPTPSELIRNQSSEPTRERELVSWGFKGSEYILVHKIGTTNGAFVGFLTSANYYNGGPNEMNISYSATTAETRSESYSIKNIERQTNQVSGSASATIPVLKVFKLGANLGFNSTWEKITETSVGTSFTEMFQKTESRTERIVPANGPGYYALAGFTRYSVYQTTICNAITGQIVSRDVWFAQTHGEPEMEIHLLKASDSGSFTLNALDIIPLGSLPIIQDITPEELEMCRRYGIAGMGNIICTLTSTEPERSIDNVGWTTATQPYRILDRISYMFNGDNMRDTNGNAVNIDTLKALGYTKVKLNLEYDYTKETDSIQIEMKIINRTTGEQFSESGMSVINGRMSFAFDLSKISRGHNVDVEWRIRKTNALAHSGVRIRTNRKYTWTFSTN